MVVGGANVECMSGWGRRIQAEPPSLALSPGRTLDPIAECAAFYMHTLDPIAECAAFHMHTLRAQGITAPAP